MKLKDAMAITLSYEQIDAIILQELKSIYEMQLTEIQRLNSLPSLTEYQRADRAYCVELRDATRVLIEYHMSHGEANEYFLSLEDNDDC